MDDSSGLLASVPLLDAICSGYIAGLLLHFMCCLVSLAYTMYRKWTVKEHFISFSLYVQTFVFSLL